MAARQLALITTCETHRPMPSTSRTLRLHRACGAIVGSAAAVRRRSGA
jgi:hypothetical protein